MQRAAKLESGGFSPRPVVTVGFVHHQNVRQFDDALFDALQFIARTGDQPHQKTVHHLTHQHLALPHPDGLHQHDVEAGGLAEHDGFTGATGHAAKFTLAGRRPDKRIPAAREFFHPRLVAQNTTMGNRAARVHREYSHPQPLVAQLGAKGVDERALARSGHTGDPHPHRATGMR